MGADARRPRLARLPRAEDRRDAARRNRRGAKAEREPDRDARESTRLRGGRSPTGGEDPGTGTRRRLFAETTAFKGFAWYDDMPKAVDLHVEIEVDGEQSRVEPADTTNRIADKVWAVLSVRRPDETIETIRIETDMGLSRDDDARHPAAAGLILSRSRKNARRAIAHAVDRALFVATDDCADGPKTQNTAFHTELEIEMTTLLDGCDAGVDAAIRTALLDMPAVPAGTTVYMASADGKAWNIETHVPESSAEPAGGPKHAAS